MKKLVRLWKRPSRDGKTFVFMLDYKDEQGQRRQISLGHADARKAERQRDQKERELRMGFFEPGSLKLSEFLADILDRSRTQVRENTLREYGTTMNHFIKIIGDVDYRGVNQKAGERFIQACQDHGNRPATARKKLRALKRMFQMAVERGQLEQNPFRYIRQPKVAKRPVRVYSHDESNRLIHAARTSGIGGLFQWDLLILTALCTGMRRGELLNCTWRDIDFEKKAIYVSPKLDSVYTWAWQIKDTDRRTVPLTDELVQLLAEHHEVQPSGYPYVFIPPARYDHIQRLRQQGEWSARRGNSPHNNFDRQFRLIREKAGIQEGEFHDLRRTCITNWFANGLGEFDVMRMAGHSNFETTRTFYLAIRHDLLDRARTASHQSMKEIFVARLLRAPSGDSAEKNAEPYLSDKKEVKNCARGDSNPRPAV
jgi:integrase